MSECPKELRYSKSHEWVREEGDGIVTVGITDYAQDALGDLVFVELPEVDVELSAGEEAVVIESVKTAADVYNPLTGTVVAVNEQLQSAPEAVNQDPYGDGWLYQLKLEDVSELEQLLDAKEYAATLEDE